MLMKFCYQEIKYVINNTLKDPPQILVPSRRTENYKKHMVNEVFPILSTGFGKSLNMSTLSASNGVMSPMIMSPRSGWFV